VARASRIGWPAGLRGFSIPTANETPDDTLPADVDPLTRWAITERLLAGLLAGHGIDELTRHEQRSDTLPAGRLGDDDLQDAVGSASRLLAAANQLGYDPARRRPYSGMVTVDGRHVEGSVSADAQQAHLVTITASRLKAKQRLRAYGHLVFLTALAPDVAWTSVLVGKRQLGPEFMSVTMGPLGADPDERSSAAVERLAALVALYDEGHHRPLPLPCETSYVWQRGLANNRGHRDAKEQWETDKYSPESVDPARLLTLPDVATFDELLGAGFEDYCARLWGPIIPLSREANL
jgi:exodeoxyribonuclease V gamma subunit